MSYPGDVDAGDGGSRKRARPDDLHTAGPSSAHDEPLGGNDGFQLENGEDDEDDEEGPKDKKAGRRKIKIEFIQDKSRRHITFSKRKAGIMKKAYELSTLTGTQVLLLVVSETGLVYTFTTAKLQPLVTQPEGKNLIQACLNAPPGQLPSSYPVGQPLGRSAPASGARHNSSSAPQQSGPSNGASNVPGTLSIGARDDESEHGSLSPQLGGDAGRAAARPRRRAAANRQSYREASESPPQQPQELSPPMPHALPPAPPPQQQQQQQQHPSYHNNGPGGYAPPGPSPLMQPGNGSYSQFPPFPTLAGPGGGPPDWNSYHRRR